MAKGTVVFIAGKIKLPLTVQWRNHIMPILHRRSGGFIDRGHTMVLITRKDTDIQGMELEATASRAINRSWEVRVGMNPAELGTIAPIHDRVYWQVKQTLVHQGLYLLVKGKDPRLRVPDVISSIGYVRRPLLIKEKLHMWD